MEMQKTFAAGVTDAANDAQAAFNRFSNSVFALKAAFAESGLLDILATAAGHLTTSANAIADLVVTSLRGRADELFAEIDDLVRDRDNAAYQGRKDFLNEEIANRQLELELTRNRIALEDQLNERRKTSLRLLQVAQTASEVFGLDATQLDDAFEAISDITAKVGASAAEIREEFDTHLPGAFQITADAIGLTADDLEDWISTGDIAASELIPELTAELRSMVTEAGEAPALELSDEYQAQFKSLFSAATRERDSFIAGFDTEEQKVDKLLAKLNEYKATLDPQEFTRIREEILETLHIDEIVVEGMLKGFLNAIRRMLANQAALQIFSAFSGFGGTSTAAASSGGSSFGGFAKLAGERAEGGPVDRNKAFIVGEEGPEIFVPAVSGTIIAHGESLKTSKLGSSFGGFRADGGPVDVGKSYIVGESGSEVFIPNLSSTPIGAGGNITYTIDARGVDEARIMQRMIPLLEQTVNTTRSLVHRDVLEKGSA
jgi:tape measure domain-containing protein